VTFGEQAAVALQFSDNTCAVAVASWGSGRVVAFPKHNALVEYMDEGDTAKLVFNAIRWSVGAVNTSAISIAVVNTDTHKYLALLGISATLVVPQSLTSVILAKHHALVIGSLIDTLSHDQARLLHDPIADFVAGGGGLLVGDTGWGWRVWWGGIDKCMGNKMLREAGILFRDNYNARYTGSNGVVNVGTDAVAATSNSPVQGLSEPVCRVPRWLL